MHLEENYDAKSLDDKKDKHGIPRPILNYNQNKLRYRAVNALAFANFCRKY